MTKPKAKTHGKTQSKPATGNRGRAVAGSSKPPRVGRPPPAPIPARPTQPPMAKRQDPVASPRPESLGMESTSPAKVGAGSVQVPVKVYPPTALPPANGVLSSFAQAQVSWYHHPDNYWVMGLVWTEHENNSQSLHLLKAGGTSQVIRVLKCYHMLHRGQSGGIDYLRIRPDEQPHFDPTKATTTRDQFETYLRDTLVKLGGAREAYKHLGVATPVAALPVTPEGEPKPVKVEHEEMYERAARLLETTVDALKAKYGHLNNGLQQMNIRNRLRAKGINV